MLSADYHHPDRYGYYQIGERRTYSKYEFIDLLKQYPADWHWDYNDAFFSSYDWSKEPVADIQELYKNRAIALREKYEYLVMYYSGGFDSSNMLYAFIDNDIKIDEICVYYSSYDTTTEQYHELVNFTYPKLKALQEKFPHIKITHWDYGQNFNDWTNIVDKVGKGDNPLYAFASGLVSMNRLIVDFAHQYNPRWREMISNGVQVGFLAGADKPMLRYKNNQWIFNFHDGILHGRVTAARQFADKGDMGTLELFYWAPTHECAEIMRKQCHMLKRVYDPQARIDFSKIPGAKPLNPSYGHEVDNISPLFVRTIYPRLFSANTIIPNERYNDKKEGPHSARNVFGNRDQWFTLANHEGADFYKKVWMSANDSSQHAAWQEWYHDKKDIRSGMTSCISRDYLI